MTLLQLYFSLTGRISRQTFWLKWILPLYVSMFVLAALDEITGGAVLAPGLDNAGNLVSGLRDVVMAVVAIAVVWASVAVQVKRWHDRDKSGWWMLLNLVPLLSLWPLVELGFLQGTQGPNKYGETTDSVS